MPSRAAEDSARSSEAPLYLPSMSPHPCLPWNCQRSRRWLRGHYSKDPVHVEPSVVGVRLGLHWRSESRHAGSARCVWASHFSRPDDRLTIEPMAKDLDVIIYGATGYTGERVARALSEIAAPGGSWSGVKWAIAGRSASKLNGLSKQWNLKPTDVIVADVADAASLATMAARGAVVMNATGPYRFYGEAVVTACIASHTDYVDLCGEPEFIDRCLLKHADAAKRAGVVVVHACAFDSVPADLGVLFTALQFPPPALCSWYVCPHLLGLPMNAPRSNLSVRASDLSGASTASNEPLRSRAQLRRLLSACAGATCTTPSLWKANSSSRAPSGTRPPFMRPFTASPALAQRASIGRGWVP